MSAIPVPCWTIRCDVCNCDPIEEAGEYAGMGPTISDARAYVEDDCDVLPWLVVAGVLDICGDHAEWSHEDDPDHRPCESCHGWPSDELLWAGNCPRCWELAMVLPRTDPQHAGFIAEDATEAKFAPLDTDSAVLQQRAASYLEYMRQVAASYGGTLISFTNAYDTTEEAGR